MARDFWARVYAHVRRALPRTRRYISRMTDAVSIQLAGESFAAFRLGYLRGGNISRDRSYRPFAGRIFEFLAPFVNQHIRRKFRRVVPRCRSRRANRSLVTVAPTNVDRSAPLTVKACAIRSRGRPLRWLGIPRPNGSPRCFSPSLPARASFVDSSGRATSAHVGIIGELSRIINGSRAKSKTRATNGPWTVGPCSALGGGDEEYSTRAPMDTRHTSLGWDWA